MPQRSRGINSVDLSILDAKLDQTLADLEILEDHIHKSQRLHPLLAGPIQITTGGGAWQLGALVTLLPKTVTEAPFDIHWICVCDISANGDYTLILYAGAADVRIAEVPFTQTAVQDAENSVPVQIPIQPVGTKIKGRLASSTGGDNASFKVIYHEY